MGHSLRIGRVFGVDLRVDTSWLVILVLMLWSLPRVFFAWHPEWSSLTVLFVALVASLTFFASVLLHELAHALVARAYGIPVSDITLHMFGGVSNIEREPPTPGAELLIAIVGPVASIVLGLGLSFAAALAISVAGPNLDEATDAESVVSQLGPIATIFLWLGPINVLVGLFNLIPGFPLDGGRVLRALVWRVTGDLGRSTRIAALVGQAVGFAFVLLGIAMAFGYSVPFFGAGLGSGLWLALIGLFLRNMAVAHYTGAAVSQALSGVRVRDLMRREGPWVGADISVRRLVDEWFLVRDERALPVFYGPRFVGLVCFQDVRRLPPDEWAVRTAADIMTPLERLTTASPDEPVEQTLRKLAASDVRQLPVIREANLAGMLFEGDVIRWLELASSRLETHRPRPHLTASAR